MKKTLFIYSILSLLSFNMVMYSQKPFDDPNENEYLMSRTVNLKNAPKNVAGSPYFVEKFQKGTIYKNNTVLKRNINLRYNASRDLVEIEFNQNQSKILRHSSNIYAVINNKQYIYIPDSIDEENNGYFVVLHKGLIMSLYKKHEKTFREGKKSINSMTSDIPATYKTKESLFLVNEKGELQELSKSKNGKIKSFISHQKELKQYVKENNLNINKENQLIKLVSYYNTL
ncbi:MAG: hypothetical protein QM499_12350 [Flavobacteriaceae bacterium]